MNQQTSKQKAVPVPWFLSLCLDLRSGKLMLSWCVYVCIQMKIVFDSGFDSIGDIEEYGEFYTPPVAIYDSQRIIFFSSLILATAVGQQHHQTVEIQFYIHTTSHIYFGTYSSCFSAVKPQLFNPLTYEKEVNIHSVKSSSADIWMTCSAFCQEFKTCNSVFLISFQEDTR